MVFLDDFFFISSHDVGKGINQIFLHGKSPISEDLEQTLPLVCLPG